MTSPLFTYGDKIRRKNGGTVLIVKDIGDNTYHFTDGTFAIIDDQDCYILVEKASGYFRVATTLDDAPLRDYLDNGYETRNDFSNALLRLLDRWAGRTGERIGERSKFLHLRFHDTPGGKPDEAWLPIYLLSSVPMPDNLRTYPKDAMEEELDRAFGFE